MHRKIWKALGLGGGGRVGGFLKHCVLPRSLSKLAGYSGLCEKFGWPPFGFNVVPPKM